MTFHMHDHLSPLIPTCLSIILSDSLEKKALIRSRDHLDKDLDYLLFRPKSFPV